jgi:hypothetical protein
LYSFIFFINFLGNSYTRDEKTRFGLLANKLFNASYAHAQEKTTQSGATKGSNVITENRMTGTTAKSVYLLDYNSNYKTASLQPVIN